MRVEVRWVGISLSLDRPCPAHKRTVDSPAKLPRVGMNNLQAFAVALCLCAIGGGRIWLAVYVVANYSESFRRNPDKALMLGVLSVVLAGPWSAPVVLAALTTALGATVLFVGSSDCAFHSLV